MWFIRHSNIHVPAHPDLAKFVHMVSIKSVKGLSFCVRPLKNPTISMSPVKLAEPEYSIKKDMACYLHVRIQKTL